MPENKFTAEVPLKINDEEGTLFFGWREIAELQSTFGNDAMLKLITGQDPIMLASVLEIGFKKHTPKFTADYILDASPILQPCIRAVDRAIALTWFGPDGKPEPKPEGEEAGTEEDPEKKNV